MGRYFFMEFKASSPDGACGIRGLGVPDFASSGLLASTRARKFPYHPTGSHAAHGKKGTQPFSMIFKQNAQHIATATINHVDVLVSWNFKHIVNLDRIHGYNSVNLKTGYPMLEIRTPAEVLKYED